MQPWRIKNELDIEKYKSLGSVLTKTRLASFEFPAMPLPILYKRAILLELGNSFIHNPTHSISSYILHHSLSLSFAELLKT